MVHWLRHFMSKNCHEAGGDPFKCVSQVVAAVSWCNTAGVIQLIKQSCGLPGLLLLPTVATVAGHNGNSDSATTAAACSDRVQWRAVVVSPLPETHGSRCNKKTHHGHRVEVPPYFCLLWL